MSRPSRICLLASIAALAALLAACGGGGGGTSGSAGTSAEAQSTEATSEGGEASGGGYPIVQTNQKDCYDDTAQIECPAEGEPFFGQDGSYQAGAAVSYTDNGDGTVTDNSTGLMWQQDPGEKTTYAEAAEGADSLELAGYDDWRLPTIKELYSLILFSGVDVSTLLNGGETSELTPFIDTDYFGFSYGDEAAGERLIDAQWTTSTVYESTVFNGQECFFGVNFADGRIKCYPTQAIGGGNGWFTYYVRETGDYGVNEFADNGDGTIADGATGLTWQQADSGEGFEWQGALEYCDSLELGSAQDWRLPNAKELQSIVDYSRAPDTTDSAAIDPLFETSSITNEGGEKDYPFFWTSTTHLSYPDNASAAAYVVFGRGLGYMNGGWIDVHGAGSQRSDSKTGDASQFPEGHGPQGDAVRIENYARCVRGGVKGS